MTATQKRKQTVFKPQLFGKDLDETSFQRAALSNRTYLADVLSYLKITPIKKEKMDVAPLHATSMYIMRGILLKCRPKIELGSRQANQMGLQHIGLPRAYGPYPTAGRVVGWFQKSARFAGGGGETYRQQ